MRLEQKVAIVTGGGSGFGEGIATRFAQEGCRVIVNDINVEGGERVAQAIKDSGGEAVFCRANVASSSDWAELLTCSLDNFGKLDIVINNAGTTHQNKSMLDVTDEEFDLVYNVNVKGIYYSARNLVPYFRKQGGGNFVTIASTAGIRPRPGLVWYCGSKAAAIIASQAMAVELAPDKIRVNVVNPVAGDTPLLAKFMGEDTPEIRAKFAAVIPLGRFSQPRDIANACLYLASDEADFITGACIEVDGGRCV
ncbi:MAG: glucose 1-dehydrogenase [Burkholderiales bacterium]|jgi:3-oxoacyl-[acyl-carrier protein] reductase|nr:glucose 1-dehydrogenase [Pseudomonadota bacterium]MDA1011386.1 glucose 1-dehydrogenase [Pseudomonadota bacterium]